jgi:transcription antitermination factor NusG
MATHAPVLIDELFGELIPAEGDKVWAVIHTKPRCEKKLAEYARNNGIWYYLPQMESKRVYQKRLVTFTKPMFPGYLFCMIDVFQRQKLTITGYVVCLIRAVPQQELLGDLLNIYHSRRPEVEYQNTLWLSKGLQVEVINGPMKGVFGIVESHDKLDTVNLQVNILRQAVQVKVNPSHLKIVGEYEIIEE